MKCIQWSVDWAFVKACKLDLLGGCVLLRCGRVWSHVGPNKGDCTVKGTCELSALCTIGAIAIMHVKCVD